MLKKLSRLLTITSAIAIYAGTYSPQVLACDHSEIEQGIPKIRIERAKSKFYQQFPDYVIEKSGTYYCCCDDKKSTTNQYIILDKDDQFVAKISIVPDEFEGNRLYLLASEVLKVSTTHQEAIRQSSIALAEDISEIQSEFGIRFYQPIASPMSDRLPNRETQRLYPQVMEDIDKNSISSSKILKTKFFVNVSEIIPGRYDYSPETIYQKGDLRKAFLANTELFDEYIIQVKKNRDNNLPYYKTRYSDINWTKIADSLPVEITSMTLLPSENN